MMFSLKSKGGAHTERAELRWKLWFSEKAILMRARTMEEIVKIGEIVGTVRSELKGSGTV